MFDQESEVTESVGLSATRVDLPVSVGGWTSESAQCILRLTLREQDRERIIRLESKSAQTSLTVGEAAELQGYEEVSVFFEFMKRSARLYLSELDLPSN
ncbi:hypothetical protein N9B57_04855 [Verrucomicrobia bacterium]|jgi:hypothetical protein|nr:hypothetical protein [Verrucomicrobiota bacterium]